MRGCVVTASLLLASRTTTMEWRKLVSLRMVAVIGATAVCVSAAMAAFYVWLIAQVGQPAVVTATETTMLTTRPGVTTTASAVLGVLCVASDRRGGGLALAAVVEPVRARLAMAKALAAAGAGVSLGLVGIGVNAMVVLSTLGRPGLVDDARSWVAIVFGSVAVHIGWAALGVAVGLLVPPSPGAILVVGVGPWLVERVVSVLTVSVPGGWLERALTGADPFAAAARLASPLTVDHPVVIGATTSVHRWAPGPDLVIFAVFVTAVLLIAIGSFTRSDLDHD